MICIIMDIMEVMCHVMHMHKLHTLHSEDQLVCGFGFGIALFFPIAFARLGTEMYNLLPIQRLRIACM